MKVTIKILQGSDCTLEVPGSTRISDIKIKVEEHLSISPHAQRLVFRGKNISDDATLDEAGIMDGAKIHLMVKKTEGTVTVAGSSKAQQQVDFFAQLDCFLRKHLTPEQTSKVVNDFRKNCELMIDSMNFDDIERFAASKCTEF